MYVWLLCGFSSFCLIYAFGFQEEADEQLVDEEHEDGGLEEDVEIVEVCVGCMFTLFEELSMFSASWGTVYILQL